MKPKKDSVFSGIFPSNEPAPPPQGGAPARPAVSEEQLGVINKKIESMERNIVGQIEKKLSEQAPQGESATIARIAELEGRIRDFQEKFVIGAVQSRNIEESKISARREIEELLKVVREQQKYSELDRQMHDQLEKAWHRVEDMEKRLLEFYGTIAAKPAPAPETRPSQDTAVLEERLRSLEASVSAIAGGMSSGRESWAAIERRLADLASSFKLDLSGLSAETRQLQVEASVNRERSEELRKDLKAGEESALGRDEALAALCRNIEARTNSLGAEIKSENERLRDGLKGDIAGILAGTMAEIRRENSAQLAKVLEIYALSAANLADLSALMSDVAAVQKRLPEMAAGVKDLLQALGSVNLAAIPGVSGAVLREHAAAAAYLAADLEAETVLLEKKKSEMEARLAALKTKYGGGAV
ncbi:MAG: hypothetical protein NDI60_04080 [Elusimicrobiales bacterium]|nr:hypothetical protein [Elusimicrobiales bacterium]